MEDRVLKQEVNNMSEVGQLLLKFLLMALAVLTPIKTMVIAAGILIFIDLVTGVWRALKNHENLTSQGFRRTLTKMAAYQLALVAGFIIEKYMIQDAVPISKIVAATIGFVEGKSIFENLRLITGVDFWQAIISKLQGKKDTPKNE